MQILKGIKMDFHSKVLITGGDGFTGIYLANLLNSYGYKCHNLDCNILDKNHIKDSITAIEPDYVFHLAAISFVGEKDIGLIYNVNVVGSHNLLECLSVMKKKPKKVILASSGTVYGSNGKSLNKESDIPSPINHYGCSKLSMEHLAKNFFDDLPIIIVRPFNYTGINHSENFIIPKIVKAFLNKQDHIELGNVNISREFNDIRDIINIGSELVFRFFNFKQFNSIAINCLHEFNYQAISI